MRSSSKPSRSRWSIVGAARSARQSRIATVEYLRDAAVAREWEASKLIRAHQIHTRHLGDRSAAMALLFGGLGYTPPYPQDWASAANLILGDEARFLAEADLYVLTPNMCDVVIAAAQSLTLEDIVLLSRDDLPSPTGLLVLPRPVVVRSVGGDLSDDRAYSWRTPAHLRLPLPPDGSLQSKDAVRMSTFHATSGPVQPASFREFVGYAREKGTPLPPLLLDAKRCLPFDSADLDTSGPARLAVAAREVDGRLRAIGENVGFDEAQTTGEYAVGDEIEDPDDTFTARFLYAFWRLCEQRIGVVQETVLTRSARLIADLAEVSPDVRVVQLRKTEVNKQNTGDGGRQWNHRWVVRMHKVRQWYPSDQRHRVIYRGPYVKGPEGKPLIGGDVVKGLVR